MNKIDPKRQSKLGTLKEEMISTKEKMGRAHNSLYEDHEEMLYDGDEFENRNNRTGRFGLQQSHEVKLKYGV